MVEDDRAIVENLREFLAGEGFCVTPASGQKEALDLLEERHFDIVLLDIDIPDMDGLSLCKNIRDFVAISPIHAEQNFPLQK